MARSLEYLIELLGFKEPKTPSRVETRCPQTALFQPKDLMMVPGYQNYVFASVVRAKEIAIHLQNVYGSEWMDHVAEVHCEDEEVRYELEEFVKLKIPLKKPVVSMTTDNKPAVFEGYHTVCAYLNQNYTQIPVTIGEPHRKSSTELGLKSFSEIIVYKSRVNPLQVK